MEIYLSQHVEGRLIVCDIQLFGRLLHKRHKLVALAKLFLFRKNLHADLLDQRKQHGVCHLDFAIIIMVCGGDFLVDIIARSDIEYVLGRNILQ